MDKVLRRKLRRRMIQRFEKTRARLIERGTTKLLTLAKIQGKQKGMLGRFRANGVPEAKWRHFQRCRPGRCRCEGSAACWFADRMTANELNRAALRILRKTKKPLHFVTIIDPLYYRAAGELSTLSIKGMMGSLRRRFRLAGEVLKGDLAYGYIEIALEILPDGREFWSAHFHIVVASDATSDAIREALRPPREMPDPESWHRVRWKPIEVKSVTNLANLLAYNGKRPPEANRITVEDGKRDRKPDRLRSDRQLEFDLWLLDQKPSDRIFKRGMRVFRGKLVAVQPGA